MWVRTALRPQRTEMETQWDWVADHNDLGAKQVCWIRWLYSVGGPLICSKRTWMHYTHSKTTEVTHIQLAFMHSYEQIEGTRSHEAICQPVSWKVQIILKENCIFFYTCSLLAHLNLAITLSIHRLCKCVYLCKHAPIFSCFAHSLLPSVKLLTELMMLVSPQLHLSKLFCLQIILPQFKTTVWPTKVPIKSHFFEFAVKKKSAMHLWAFIINLSISKWLIRNLYLVSKNETYTHSYSKLSLCRWRWRSRLSVTKTSIHKIPPDNE